VNFAKHWETFFLLRSQLLDPIIIFVDLNAAVCTEKAVQDGGSTVEEDLLKYVHRMLYGRRRKRF
jgi:hypothetical protein